ncbi:MAG: hypothetical protein GY940_27385 [bacterium]|nr:hypothetical protein [bacterium]
MQGPPFDTELVRGGGDGAGGFPSLYFRNKAQSDADVTVVTYGGMTGIVEAAMKRLIVEEEYFFDYIVLTRLWPLQLDDIIDSVKGSGKLVVVEEGPAEYGIGSAVIAGVVRNVDRGIDARAVGAEAVPIPAARVLENRRLPDGEKIIDAIRSMDH